MGLDSAVRKEEAEGFEESENTQKASVIDFPSPKKSLNPKLSQEALSGLIIEHMEHGEKLARSFLNKWRVRMHPSEITSVVGVALCEAANRFDPDRNVAFRTFFFYHLRGLLIKEISRIVEERKMCQTMPQIGTGESIVSEHALAVSWPSPLVDSKTPERILQKKQLAKVCWKACAHLDPLEQEVIIRHYVFDQALVDIAKELNYCRCHISRVKSRALSYLQKRFGRLFPGATFSTLKLGEFLQKETVAGFKPRKRRKERYTGGRGRRKQEEETASSKLLEMLLREAEHATCE